MKQNNNNEMDLLLRSLARAERSESPLGVTKASRRDEGVLSDHLDVDELNSFAESVVPAPARARYLAHLADCGSCRATVISLTRASGAATRSETLEQQTGAGIWQKLTTLFSPPVLRYAVPALALAAVIGISLIALRQQRRQDFVAQNQPTVSTVPAYKDEQQIKSPAAQSNTQALANTPSDLETRLRSNSSGDQKTAQAEKSGEDRGGAETAEVAAPLASVGDAAPGKQGYVAGASRPVFAPETQAAPPPPPAKPALKEADTIDAFKKDEVARREAQAFPHEEEKNQQPRDEPGQHGPSRSNTQLSARKRADGLMTESRGAKAKSKEDSDDKVDEVETRTVSGKRFRRQGSAWIDTAYDSSRRTINVSRGSEQFRALVADEPGIRTIAERLSGVVIVVWNGRAYRIQ